MIIKETVSFNSAYGLEYNDDVVITEVELDDSEVNGFTQYELELIKRWQDIWYQAYEEDTEVWEVKQKLKREFKEDYEFIFQFEYIQDLYDYEPDDFMIFSNGTIKVGREIVKNLKVEFLKDEKYDIIVTEYTIK